MEKENIIYGCEGEDLEGSEGLSTYDLTLMASRHFQWFRKTVDEIEMDKAS